MSRGTTQQIRDLVWHTLNEGGSMTTVAIAKAVGVKANTLLRTMDLLHSERRARKVGDVWVAQ